MPRKAKSEQQTDKEETPATVDRYIDLTASLACSYVSRNQVPMNELPGLIAMLHAALSGALPKLVRLA